MASRDEITCARCSICADNYPPHMAETLCPNCGTRLDPMSEQDPDPELVERHGCPSHLRAPSSAPVPEAAVEVRAAQGLTWISALDLGMLGYYDLADFDVVKVGGVHYELQGFRASTNEWWLERKLPVADLTP